jgi:intraflagellar transport protein 172
VVLVNSQKLAVAQSDNIVFIYKLGATWAEKKTICNKFLQPAAVTCMCWPSKQPNAVVFATMDGKVRIGLMKSNKTQILYTTDSYVVSMCARYTIIYNTQLYIYLNDLC